MTLKVKLESEGRLVAALLCATKATIVLSIDVTSMQLIRSTRWKCEYVFTFAGAAFRTLLRTYGRHGVLGRSMDLQSVPMTSCLWMKSPG